MEAGEPTRHRLSGMLTAWAVPLDSSSANLQLGSVVFFMWMHKGGGQGGFHHLDNFGPPFGGCKEPPSREPVGYLERKEEMGWWFWRELIGKGDLERK